MNAVVDMTYGDPLTRVHARSGVAPEGFGYLAPRQKTFFRLIIFGIPLVLALTVWGSRLRCLKRR